MVGLMRSLPRLLVYAAVLASLGVSEAVVAQEKVEPPFRRKIVGGEATDIKQHPWQVALQFRGIFFCGGSIIAQKWILTAAHCFQYSSNNTDWRAKADATDYSGNAGWLEPERVVIHEAYNAKTYDNDIALIKLKTPPPGRVIPPTSASISIPAGQPLEVTGWGAVAEKGPGSAMLLKAMVPLASAAECNAPQSYNGQISEKMMCAGYREGGVDACQGDSGGPLVWRTSDGPVLVGVVSFGDGCARKLKYGVYTRVSAYRNWIDRIIAADRN